MLKMENKGKVYQLSFDEYDEITEKFEKMKVPSYYPSIRQIDEMQKDPGKWLLFACYLLECGTKPKNHEEEYRLKSLRGFVEEHLELVDSEDEIHNHLEVNY